MAVPWAWAFDTPYKWTKQVPSFFGGTRQGMAISWPGHITDKGGIRWQFHHVIDIVPTMLEVTGIPAPVMVDGIAQKPIEGVSLAYTFDKANADAPSPHKTQYFEMMGVQGLYNDGWMLSAVPVRPPWQLLGKAIQDPATAYKFELYDVRQDWTQYTDVAAAESRRRCREMTDLMFAEFAKYQVLPLDASVATRHGDAASDHDRGPQGVHLFAASRSPACRAAPAPSLLNTSYTITAEIDVPQGGAEGMIVTDGGRFGGYGLYLLKGKPVFTWNLLDLKRVKWEGDRRADAGQAHARLRLQIRRARLRDAGVQQHQRHRPRRHGNADGRRQGRRDADDGAHRAADAAVGRDLRHRLGHRHAGRRPATTRCRSPSPARSTS